MYHPYALASTAHRAWTIYVKGCKKLPERTISVGNWTWGGTGKTPLCEWLAHRLGVESSVILTRGYRGGDEASMLAEFGCQVGVGKSRYTTGLEMWNQDKAKRIRYWILDDGLQHWALVRDVEIITVDCLLPFGINGRLIPCGSLRERPELALRRAHIVVLHNADLVDAHRLEDLDNFVRSNVTQNVAVVHSIAKVDYTGVGMKHSQASEIRIASSENATARCDENHGWILFSGLGNNNAFFTKMNTIARANGVTVLNTFGFPDHHVFTANDIKLFREAGESQGRKITYLTTAKDMARCSWLADAEILGARAVRSTWEPLHPFDRDFALFERIIFGL